MKGGTQVYGGKLEEVTICKYLRKGKGGKQVKKLKTKFFALSMAFVMILSIIQSGAVPMVQAAGGTDENKVEYELLDQAPMKASVRASSEVSAKDWGDGPATYAFDGNADTTWHTNYDGTKSVLPQSIEWDLGGTYLIGQLSYVRKSTAENGTWKEIVVTATLKDGTTKVVYNQAMPETAMGATTLIQFAPVEANHLKVDIRSNYKGGTDTFAAAAEINVYKAIVKEPEPPVVEKPITVTPNTLTLIEGQAFELKYALTPEAQDAGWVGAWDSANTNSGVVKFDVNTGKGVAVGTGDVTIQAKATLTTVTGSTTKFAGCKIHVNKAEVRSVIVLNGTEYTAESLEDAIAQFGLTNGNPKENISSIEFKSGAVRDEDLDYLVAHKKWFDFELKSFKIADDVAVYGLSGNEIPGNVFQLNGSSSTSLEHVYLGKNIKGLAKGAFSKCYDLKTFEAPGLEYLKENSLARVKVEEFNFPALKKIEEDAFGIYTNAVTTKISLPAVETLEHDTFKYFTNLKELTFGAEPPQIRITANTEFEFAKGVKENLKLNIPDGALEAYMNSAGYDADNGTWYGIPKNALVLQKPHVHQYTYMAKDNKITESCICGHSASATITAEDAEYTGEEMKTAEVAYTENWVGNKPEIVYENNMEVGTATAKITVEQVTARVSFEITDTTAPEVMVEQIYNEKSNTVTVTLTSNEPLKKPEGWSASDEEGKVFTKVYGKNGIYELLLEDVHGNAVETRFEVDSIKKDITPEKPKPEDQSGKPSKPTNPENPGKPAVPEKNSSTAVQTGDTTSMVPALIGILVAIVAIGVVIYRKRSKHDKHRK